MARKAKLSVMLYDNIIVKMFLISEYFCSNRLSGPLFSVHYKICLFFCLYVYDVLFMTQLWNYLGIRSRRKIFHLFRHKVQFSAELEKLCVETGTEQQQASPSQSRLFL